MKRVKQSRKEIMKSQTDKILNKVVERINESGSMPWQKPWQGVISNLSPLNFISGRKYSGSNIILLHMVSFGKIPAFSPSSKLHKAKKGAKCCYILKPNNRKIEDKQTGEEKYIFSGCSLLPVFHYTDLQGVDCEAIEAKYGIKSDGNTRSFVDISECEAVYSAMPTPPKLDNNGGDRAYYSPSEDSISLPKKETFIDEPAYYQTMFHELAHSRGHFTRLDRFKKNKINFDNRDHDYSFEELVAELTACFIGSQTGTLTDKEEQNSAAYLKHWVSKLRDNPDWLILAATQANKASEYILGKSIKEDDDADK
jgi:antirestriction protein ArdC